jgi:hypothetical protein
MSASAELALMTTPEFDPDNEKYEDKDTKNLEEQLSKAQDKYNEMDQKWKSEQYKLGLLMNYYHHGKPEVGIAWQGVQDAVTAQFKCTDKLFLDRTHVPPIFSTQLCEGEKKQVIEGLNQLTKALEQARHYLGEDVEAADKQ